MTVRTRPMVAIGGTLAVAYPIGARVRTVWRETAAAERLIAIVEAQKAFRDGAGRGGYAHFAGEPHDGVSERGTGSRRCDADE